MVVSYQLTSFKLGVIILSVVCVVNCFLIGDMFMKMQVMAIFDKALGAYSRPLFTASRGQAVRAFTDDVNNAQSDLSKHRQQR